MLGEVDMELVDSNGDMLIHPEGVFAFGTPDQVKEQVKRQCDILNKNGGFVFNTVHNIQANVPFENVVSMLETLKGL